MIDEEITFILFKYNSEDLSSGSHKKVLAVCNECGKENLVEYRRCKTLCASCSHKGKHHSEETKQKMSKSKQGMYNGDKHPRWKGGSKLSSARESTKRRKLFGFISHNKPQKDFHGHHLDFNHVIFIPKELHMSISHSVINNKNMDIINGITCDWYLEYQIIT